MSIKEKIKKKIKNLFSEIKELSRDRKRIVQGLIKEAGDDVAIFTLADDSAIKERLFTLTVLLKILLENNDLHDVHLGDLGKRHIYLGYMGDKVLKGIKYRVY